MKWGSFLWFIQAWWNEVVMLCLKLGWPELMVIREREVSLWEALFWTKLYHICVWGKVERHGNGDRTNTMQLNQPIPVHVWLTRTHTHIYIYICIIYIYMYNIYICIIYIIYMYNIYNRYTYMYISYCFYLYGPNHTHSALFLFLCLAYCNCIPETWIPGVSTCASQMLSCQQ